MAMDMYAAAKRIVGASQKTSRVARALVPSRLAAWVYQKHFETVIAGSQDPKAVFGTIYRTNWWRGAESRSGPGSDLANTAEIRDSLADWLSRHAGEVKSLLDAPCGDFNWMRYTALPDGLSYIGGDIVPEIAASNEELYGSPLHRFLTLDIAADPIPEADAWLCRDVLFHLPYEMGVKVCEAFRASNTRYFLSTTYPGARNDRDIKVGWFRPIDLATAPFNLGEPLELLPDNEEKEGKKFIGVWRNARVG